MFALAGLGAGKPAAVRVSSYALDQEPVINSILLSLTPAIDAAVNRALGQTTSIVATGPDSDTYSEEAVSTSFSGSVGNTYYEGTYDNSVSSFNANGAGVSGASAGQTNSVQYDVSSVSSSPNQGQVEVTYHDTGYDHTHQNGGNYQQTQTFHETGYDHTHQNSGNYQQQTQTFSEDTSSQSQSSTSSSSSSSSSLNFEQAIQEVQDSESALIAANQRLEALRNQQRNEQQQVTTVQVTQEQQETTSEIQQNQLVQTVLSSLQTSVRAAVEAALKRQTASVSTVTSQVSGSASVKDNSQVEQALVTKICKALNPAIVAAVRKALAAQAAAQAAAAQAAAAQAAAAQAAAAQAAAQAEINTQTTQVTQTSSSSLDQSQLVSQIISALTPQISASVSSALSASQQTTVQTQESSSSSSSSSSSAASSSSSSTTIVSQVLAALRPIIVSTVNEALESKREASQVTQTQVTQTSSSSLSQSDLIAKIIAALQSPIRLSVAQALAQYNSANSVATTQVVQQPIQQVTQTSSSGSSGLVSIFGDGKSHNVHVETPQYAFEYNN